jgi:glycine cleavage system H protein
MDATKLRYSKTHEWASLAGDVCTVGISKFAADQLQDITYIKLPAVGTKVSADASFGEIETVKAVSDLYSPVAGEVVAVNTKAAEDMELIKNDPFGNGWLIRVKMAPGSNLNHLMDHAAYERQCNAEPH